MSDGAPSVEVTNLTVRFGDFTAVNNISFTVSSGEIFGLLGANGAGKTTTIRVLCGLLLPSAGRVRVAGASGDLDAIKAKVGYMSQKFTLYSDLTIQENLAFAASLRKLPDPVFKQRMSELFAFIGFAKPPKTLVRDLPGGIKQQVSLVASILHDPAVVFLDEPTAGVTPAARARFWELIRQLASGGKTVFVTTHYMDEAEQCGRIALMRAGEIIALDSASALKERTFPNPLLEMEFPASLAPDARNEWLRKLRESPAILSVQPYGMRYHVAIADPAEWKRVSPGIPEDIKVRPITPSLEDVFIHLVEGANR